MYPVKRFSRPVRGTWKNRGPVFSAFLFFTNPILYSFSRYPPFFLPPSSSPPSVSPRFLPLVDGKGENLAGEWKGEESVHMCVCVCMWSRGCERWSVNFQERLYQIASFSPLCPLFFGSWMNWSTLVLLHPSFRPFSTSFVAKILKIDFKIGCRFCRFSIGPIVSNVAARMARKRGRSEAKTLSNQSFLAE